MSIGLVTGQWKVQTVNIEREFCVAGHVKLIRSVEPQGTSTNLTISREEAQSSQGSGHLSAGAPSPASLPPLTQSTSPTSAGQD